MYEATRWYGRRGAVMHAMAAVDTALWDIVGQHRRRPCHAVWGTRRHRVRAYASVLFRDGPDSSAVVAADLAVRGFTAISSAGAGSAAIGIGTWRRLRPSGRRSGRAST